MEDSIKYSIGVIDFYAWEDIDRNSISKINAANINYITDTIAHWQIEYLKIGSLDKYSA